MAQNTLSGNRGEGNKYRTRYGLQTADEAAYNLLDRSWARLRFLEEMFSGVNVDGEGFTLKNCSNLGLAAILEDIAIDVHAAHAFHSGSDNEPGKTDEAPEVKP